MNFTREVSSKLAPKMRPLPCWCGQNRWVPFTRHRTPGRFLLRCSGCGCFQNDPPPVATDDQLSAFYSQYYQRSKPPAAAPHNPTRHSRFWRVAAQVPELLTVQRAVLDIGCGDGQLCAELSQAGWSDVTGIDVSRSRIAYARQAYPQIRFSEKPIEEIGRAPAALDLAISDNVIEHVPQPVDYLARIKPYLAATGKLVIITPNMTSGNFRLLGKFWTPELAPHTHIFLFTPTAMRQCMQAAGYEVTRQGTFHLPISAMRKLSLNPRVAAWNWLQLAGACYSRVVRSGSMLYAIGTPK